MSSIQWMLVECKMEKKNIFSTFSFLVVRDYKYDLYVNYLCIEFLSLKDLQKKMIGFIHFWGYLEKL